MFVKNTLLISTLYGKSHNHYHVPTAIHISAIMAEWIYGLQKMCLYNHKCRSPGFNSPCCILFLTQKKSQVKVHIHSWWSPPGVLQESTRSLPGVVQEFTRSPQESTRSPPGVHQDLWESVNYSFLSHCIFSFGHLMLKGNHWLVLASTAWFISTFINKKCP